MVLDYTNIVDSRRSGDDFFFEFVDFTDLKNIGKLERVL